MLVRDLMHRNVDVAPATSTLAAAKRMRDENVGCLVVFEDRRMVGLVTDRDLVVRTLAEGFASVATVRDAMSAIVLCCRDDTTAEEARDLMTTHRIHRLPVIDRAGRLIGMVSADDLEGRRAASQTYRVTFYKRLSSSQGVARNVALTTIHVSPNHPQEEVLGVAIQRFERERGGNSWRFVADGYEVGGPFENDPT